MEAERECCNCGAVLGGYGFKAADKQWYCTTACERDAWPDDDDEGREPEEDREGQYDTLEERDIDRMDCPDNQFD